MTIWAGPGDDLVDALTQAKVEASRVRFITIGSFDRESISRWCGIDPPPDEADSVIYQAPIEADGTRTWREYRHPSNVQIRVFAPEVDVIFAVF